MPEYVTIGQIKKPHGVKGSLKVEPLTNDPSRFKLLDKIYLTFDEKVRKKFSIVQAQIGPQFVYLTLDQITNRDEAEKFRSAYIEIPQDESLPLLQNEHYNFELVGFLVKTNDGKEIGTLKEVQSYPAHDMYIVKTGSKEILIPAVPEIVVAVKADTKEIIIDPIEGLLDLGL
jgi:16S rRNA processing protein RimM